MELRAENPAPTAAALAASLSSSLQDGSSVVRLKLEVRQPTAGRPTVLQLQVSRQVAAVGLIQGLGGGWQAGGMVPR